MNDQFESNYGLLVRSEEKGRGVLEALTDKLWGNANSRMEMSATPAQDVYEIRPREERDGFDLIVDRLQDGPIWYAGPDAVRRAVAYAKYRSRSRSHRAIIRVVYEAGNVVETHEHTGEFKNRNA
jgi:transposase